MGKAELDSRDIHYRRLCADLGMARLSRGILARQNRRK
jgi:hypothetical protein